MFVAVIKGLQEEAAPKQKAAPKEPAAKPTKEKKVRAHIFVSGHVQGVFYRAYAQEVARNLEITGWVRNIADGRVEIVAEGVKAKLEEFIKKLRGGPAAARPGDIEVEWLTATGEFSDFEIRYDWK